MMRFWRLVALATALLLPLEAQAQALLLFKAGSGRAAGGGGGMTFTYGSASDNSAQSTYTFASQAVGAASANRVIVVAFSAETTSNATITGVNIGGVAATKDEGESAASLHILEIWSAVVPAGTSITITATLSNASAIRAALGWAAILGSTQTTHFAIADANTKLGSGTNITSGSLSMSTNGFAFAAVRWQNAAAAPLTWSQSSGAGTKQMDTNVGVNLSMGTYSSSFTASGASTFTAANNPGTTLSSRIAAVSWAP